MTFNPRKNRMMEIARKRATENEDIKRMWAKSGGFQPTEDALRDKYANGRIKPEDLPY